MNLPTCYLCGKPLFSTERVTVDDDADGSPWHRCIDEQGCTSRRWAMFNVRRRRLASQHPVPLTRS